MPHISAIRNKQVYNSISPLPLVIVYQQSRELGNPHDDIFVDKIIVTGWIDKERKASPMNRKDTQFIVFQMSDKGMKLLNSHPVSGGNRLTLAFRKETSTWKLEDEMDNPLYRLFSAIKRLLQTEKRFEGSVGVLAQKLKTMDDTLDYVPNALTRIFNRHSLSMEYEYGILYRREKRTSGAREFVLSLQK